MSNNQPNLFAYSDAEDPVIKEVKPIPYPQQRDKFVGFIGPSNHGNAIVCQRLRHPDPATGEQHYYRKIGGYSLSLTTLRRLKKIDVEVVFIEEIDNGRVVQYNLSQFDSGILTEEIEDDPQRSLTVDEAVFTWPRSRTTIMKANGTERDTER